MAFFKNTRSRQALMRAALGLLCLTVLVVATGFMARAAFSMYQKFAEASEGDEAAQKQLASLEARHTRVSVTVDSFSTERGLEAQVRGRWGMGKPGEGEIDIIRNSSTTTPGQAGGGSAWERFWATIIPF